MRKVNTNQIAEIPWTSPKGKFAGAGKEVSEELGRKPQSTDLNERHPFDVEGMALVEVGGLRLAAKFLGDFLARAGEFARGRCPGDFGDLVGVYFAHGVLLELHRREVFDVGGLALAVEGDDEGEPNGNFGGGDGDDEEDEDLAVGIVGEPGKGDEREVGGVEHQFKRHVDDEQIAPDDDAEEAEAEQDGADCEVMFEADGHFKSFLLRRMTPTIATRRRTDTISNGSR